MKTTILPWEYVALDSNGKVVASADDYGDAKLVARRNGTKNAEVVSLSHLENPESLEYAPNYEPF